MSVFFNESFVIAVCFTIFIYMAYRPIKNAILNALDSKISEIRTKLIETDQIKHDAQKLLEATQKEIDLFEEKKKQMLKNAEKVIKSEIELKKQEMELLFNRLESSANQNLQHEIAKAGNAIKKEFSQQVIHLVTEYMKETKTNSLSDEEILEIFTKENFTKGKA